MEKYRLVYDIREVMKYAKECVIDGDNSSRFFREIAEKLGWIIEDIEDGDYD